MGPQRRKRTENNSDVSGKKRKRRCKERGRTVLDLVTKALKEKKPIELEWDKVHRLPTGTFAGKFSSWIGVTARRHVSCIVETWDDVDDVLRKEILDSITGAFTVIKDRHDWCLIKAGKLWRKWKCTLVRKWLYDETGAIRRTPPELYDHITPEEWNAFVASHTTEAFKEISAINKRNASMNNTRFYGSRAGYRGIEVIVKKDFASKGHVLETVDRHLTWLRGHTPTNGDMTEYDKEVALKIKAVEKEVAAGTFKPEGREDILAKAIGRPEHGGRVRGVPDGISITEYFGRASKKPTTEVERLKETINTMQAQVSNMQTMFVHFWQTGEKPSQEVLECFMKGMSMSTQGSKACASMDGSHSISIQENEEQSHQEPHRKESEEQSRQELSLEKMPHEEPSSEQQGWRDCELSLPGNLNKMVASGFMYMESKEESVTVHGIALLNGYKKVELKKIHSGFENAKLPVPIRDELIVLIDAKDSYVQWPQNHIHITQFFVEIVTRAFEKRNSIDPLAGFDAKPLTWKLIKCPMQPLGSVLCGYYVCRYMLELIKGRYINITPNFMLNAPKTYTVEQIDEVRNIWAEFTLNFKPRSNGE